MQCRAACTIDLYELTKLRAIHASFHIATYLTNIYEIVIHFDQIIKGCLKDIYI